MIHLVDAVDYVEPASVNERRTIWEPVNNVALQRVQAFRFSGAKGPGGNHYHRRLKEYFFVVQGCMTLLVLEDVNSKERRIFRNLGPGARIVIPPFVAHANCFEEGTILVAGCTTSSDPNDLDTYPYRLINADGEIAS